MTIIARLHVSFPCFSCRNQSFCFKSYKCKISGCLKNSYLICHICDSVSFCFGEVQKTSISVTIVVKMETGFSVTEL